MADLETARERVGAADQRFRRLVQKATLLRFHGPQSKAVLWEHNSHLGDAAATRMEVMRVRPFHAVLPIQFDEYVRFDETHAVRPVTDDDARRLPRTHPFAPYGRA